jgi:pimeloyl-ACP methyl ester carboxylesterase
VKRWTVGLLFCMACGSGTGPTGVGSTLVLFEVPRRGEMPDLFALPFPNDLRLKADGTLDLRGFPPGLRPDVIRSYQEATERQTHGWATNPVVYFRFSAPIDPTGLPANSAASTQGDASVFLVDIDPSSPRLGTRVPILTRYYPEATVFVPQRVLALTPLPGFSLRGATRYAAVVTHRLRDATGALLGSPGAFEAVKASLPQSDPDLERARALYAPALATLEGLGVRRADLRGLAVFTTQDPTKEMDRVRAFLRASVPEPDARGVACAEEPLYLRCTGWYDTPNFQAGTIPYQTEGGNFVFTSSGDPVVQRTETIPFTLTLPKTSPPTAGFPVTLYAHGTGGSRNSFLGANDVGDVLARQGIAVIGIDQPLHGARDTYCPQDPALRDQCESLWSFNPANIAAARDNFRQGAVDDLQLLRLVKRLTIARAVTGLDADVRFDPSNIFFFGHSHGGLTGPLFVGVEPEVRGAVLSGSGGLLGLAFLLKTKPTDIKGTVEWLLGIEGMNELDIFHPVITLVQTFAERADPLNYAARFVGDPPGGAWPRAILLTEGLGDSYTPNANTEALAVAAGLSPVTPVLHEVEGLSYLGREALVPPVSNNLTGPGGVAATGVLAQYAPARDAATNPDHDGHFTVFWNSTARAQYGGFLGSLARTGTATFPAP